MIEANTCDPLSFLVFSPPTQTHAVLRQAWSEGMKPCLVLNKVRLANHKVQAFIHVNKCVQRGSFIFPCFHCHTWLSSWIG